MSLKNLALTFPKETITLSGGSFTVRGLSLSDITILVNFHRERLGELYEQFATTGAGGLKELSSEAGLNFAAMAISSAPVIVAHVIALGEDREPDADPAFDVALKLPLDVQIDALEKILRLTFDMAGGPKKVMETVVRAVMATTKFATTLVT